MSIHAVDKNMLVENVIIEYRDRPEGSESKLNTYSDGMKVLMTIGRLFKNYRPLQFFSAISVVLTLISVGFFIPILMKYIRFGVVTKMPTLIVICFVILAAIISWFSGLILSTLVQQHKQDFEFKMQQVTNEYKQLFGND
jgi:ABC-type polysaccharide/polyol phosphate export permease